MYDNIGSKIKQLAKAIFIIEAIVAVIIGIVLCCSDEDLVFTGILTAVVGPIGAWVSSWLLYGFGELIDKTSEIARNTYGGQIKSEAQAKVDYARISQIERLRSQALITEEEYQKLIAKCQ